MIKILFAIPELDSGGPDRVIFELACGLPRARFEVHLLVTAEGGRYFDALLGDVVIHQLGDTSRYPVRAFARAVDAIRPDAVMTTLRMNTTGGLARYFQKRRVPLIARQANAIAADFALLKAKSLVKHRIAERIVRHALRQADAVVAQSHDMARELRRELKPQQRLEVVGNPVSIEDMQERARASKDLSLLPGSPKIVSVGRLSAQKGYDLLLPAFAQLRQTHPEAELTILGEGPDRPALEQQAIGLGLAKVVHLPGKSDHVAAITAGADLFVSSSRYEGFSNAILEAMALAVPVAATDCPGATRELILDGGTGMLANKISEQEIANAMLRALNADRQPLGNTGRDHVARLFDRPIIIEKYAALFEQLAARSA